MKKLVHSSKNIPKSIALMYSVVEDVQLMRVRKPNYFAFKENKSRGGALISMKPPAFAARQAGEVAAVTYGKRRGRLPDLGPDHPVSWGCWGFG